jgi:exonuclease SbcC
MVKKGDELEMMITRAKKEIGENPEGFLQAIKNDLEEKRQKLYNLKASKLQEESNIQKLEGTDGRCPVCDSEVDELKKIKLISDKQANLDRIEKKIATINEFVVKDLMDIEKIEKSVFDIKVAEDFINGMKDRSELFETHKKEYEKVNEQLETLKSKKEKIQSDLEKLRKSLETKSAERERLANFADIGKEVDSLEKELAGQTYKEKLLADEIERINVKFRQIEISHMRTEYEGVIARKNSLEAEIKGIGEIIADKNSRLSELKKEEQTIASYVEETESYQKIAAMLDDFIETLKTTQEQLRSEFLVNVNSIMAHVWPELYPYGDFSEVRLVIDNDYVLQLNSSKGWVSADLVSGGERSLACLALRVAFSLAFAPNIKWLILDEPTHNLDANAIRKLGDTLKDKLDQFIDQVFLITHEEMLADSITGTLYKLEREKEKDAATKVVKI